MVIFIFFEYLVEFDLEGLQTIYYIFIIHSLRSYDTDCSMHTLAQFIYWTQDEFAAAFRRILLLERYNDEGIERLYNMYLGSGPLEYVRDVLSFALPGENAELLAVKYYAPMYFLMELEDSNEALKLLERHIEDFERKLL